MEIRTDGKTRYFSGDITPGEGIVMVFGSNPEGRHGAGAAKVAREQFGAVYGQGEGLQGNAYALPTKDLRVKENRSLRSISPEAITENIKRLYDTARQNPDKTFCIAYRNTDRQSLNGYTGIEMMRMFAAAGPLPENVLVSEEWHDAGKEILSYEAVIDDSRRKLATDTAMFLADKLNGIGIKTVVVSQDQARDVLRNAPDEAEFSVADIQRLNYEWNGEQISMKVFAQTFGDLIKQKDRTMEDVERIAAAYIDSVKADPAAFVPQLKPENMSHWRYFVLPDGSVYTPQHLMANSPEYQTQKGLYEIYERVLGDRIAPFIDGVSRYALLSETEKVAFLEMEREVSGSDLMQRTLETNAEKVNERRNRDIVNLIQYFDGNSDYTTAEKALILKGSMTYSYSEKKKDGGRNEVKLVRITDANDVSVPVLGGDAATIAEGLRKGLNFKDSLVLARNSIDDSRNRSVARDFTGWKVYPKSNREEDAVILQKDAAGTGWCTGGAVSTARTHLSGGDFHIYFENGEPLVAIRTEDGRLAEAPRGAHEGQFCTPREEEIAFSYIQEGHGITGGKDYVADMQDLRKLNSPDCTWRDVIGIPARRRYENGEYGGDTGSWGEAAEVKIRQIMKDSRDERFAEDYYTPQEIAERNVPHDRVKGLLNNEEFEISGEWPNLEFVKGSIFVGDEGVILPNCRNFVGGVVVLKNSSLAATNVESIGGHVMVWENSHLEIPNVGSIGGDVKVWKNGHLEIPNVGSIGGDVEVWENGQLEIPNVGSIGGDVEVWENGQLEIPNVGSIGGYVEVAKNGRLEVPNVESIGGFVQVRGNGHLEIPNVESIGGYVEVWENGHLEIPNVENIGGHIIVYSGATVNLENCKSAEYLVAYKGATVTTSLPCLTSHPNLPDNDIPFHLSNGTVYGYERDNTIYLTPEGINPNTPVHEYAHLWAKAMQKTRPEQWNAIKETLRTLPAWNMIYGREDYAFLRNDEDRLAGEVLATVTGDKAEEILMQTAEEVMSEGRDNVEDVVVRLKQTIGKYVTEDLFDLKEQVDLNVETITLGVMKSLVEQKDVLNMRQDEEESLSIGHAIEDLMIGKAYGAFDDYDVKDSYEVSFDYKGKKYDTLTVDDVLESEDGDHSLYVVLRGKKGQITVDPIEIITIAQTIVSPEQKNKLFHEVSRFLDDARRNRQQKISLDELLNFHSGSMSQYVDDNLATANRPFEEVMGDALSNTVRDALERGDNPAVIRLWADRAMKENDMTPEQRAVAEEAVKSIVMDDDIVLGSDGKPLVLWHGSPAEFEEFDFSHAGDNTGLVEYTNRETGEKVVSDSDKAIFFTDNRELAVSYGFLARNMELRHLTGLMTDIISCLRDPEHSMTDYIKSKKDLIEAAQTLRRENDPEINAFLDRLPDLNGEKPISSMDADSREELRNELIQIRTRYSKYTDMNRNGGVSNQLNNIVRQRDYLTYFVENFDRVCEGDSTVLTEFGKDFNHYSQQFFSKDGNVGVDFFLDGNGEMMVSGFEEKPVSLKSLSLETRKEILQRIEDDLNGCIAKYNANIDESGYRKHTHLYPVLLKAQNPLEHDYQESAFPDKYKPNEKYGTAYIAARQVKKALADGNDAVVYRNIRDPFLGDTYGVFSKENIVMLDRSLLPEEQLDSTLGKVSGTVQRYMDSLERKNMEQRELRFIEDISGLMDREFIPKYDTHAQNELLKAVCRYHGDSVSFPPETHLTWSVAGDNGIDYESEYEVFIDKMYVDNDEIFCDGSLDNGRKFEHRLLRDEKPYYDFILDLAPEGLLYPLTVLNGGDTLSSELFQKVLDYRKNVNETTMDENVKKAIQFEKELKSNLNVRYKSCEEYYYEREDNWDVIRYKAFESTLKDAINDHYPNDVVFEWAMMHVADMKADEKQVDVALKCEEFYESFLCGDNKEENQAVNEIEKKNGNNTSPVSFVEDDSPYYKERTRRNAEAADVTVAFALDFNTAGERCTKNVAGDRYIAISLPPQNYFKEPDTKFSKSLLKEKVETLEAAIMVRSQEHGFPFVGVNVNVAGNGLYTLVRHGVSQADVDRFVTDVFRQLEKRPNVHVRSIRSGGQTGIDEAGIKAAVALDIPATVLAPQGWKFRDENGNDISDEKAFKARFPETRVKENGLKPLTEEEMLQTRGGVRIDEPEKQPESGMKPLSEEEMKTIRGGVEIAPQQAPQPVDSFRRIAEAAVSSGKVRSVGELKDGWALVQANNGKFNYTNDKGKFMTKNWFDSATEFNKGVATIKRDGCTAKINRDGIAVEVVNNMAQRTGNSPKIG